MKTYFFLLLFFLCVLLFGFSEEFSLAELDAFGQLTTGTTVVTEEAFYVQIGRSKIVRADYHVRTTEIIYEDYFAQIFGPYQGEIVIPHPQNMDSEENDKYFAYDIQTGVMEEANEFEFLKSLKVGNYPVMIFYQNGLAFAQEYHASPRTGKDSRVSIIDFLNKTRTNLGAFGEVSHISPDKLHLLIRTDLDQRYELHHIQNETAVVLPKLYGANQDYREARFLNNEIIIVPQRRIEPTEFVLLNINDPSKQYGVDFLFPDKKTDYITFSPDLTRAIARNHGFVFVDTTPFRDWLNENGFLFKPTTAIANETQIRVRENPNLEAQNLGHLTTGDELEVTGRSGIKVQIGDWNEWWYKIRRKSDGLEGWAYGAFIDVAEEQGLLGAEVLGLK